MNQDFLTFLQNSDQKIFIEAEARRDKMLIFINNYNNEYSQNANINTDGICLLGDVDKWGGRVKSLF